MKNGFSLIELMLAIAILAVLMGLALPAYQQMIASARLRSTAEMFNQGLQLARSEAIKHNDRVFFSYSTTGWTVGCVSVTADCPANIQSKVSSEGSRNVTVTVTPAGASKVTFTSLGRLFVDSTAALKNPDGSTEFSKLDFAASGTTRKFTVMIRPAGQVKLCDPNAASGSVMSC